MQQKPARTYSPTVRYARNIAEALRLETLGGFVMLGATLLALLWANSPWSGGYEALRDFQIGPAALHLDGMTLHAWASDGLLAVFFFLVGLELREELTHGELRNPKDAALPILAAFCGVLLPALIFLGVSAGVAGASRGWAIPTATDIAFALAVLAVAYPRCPAALRAFLLTLAVVDDLVAISIIAFFYTASVAFWWLLAALALVGLYGALQARGLRTPLVYVPIALVAWYALHESGVHATVAGVALGLLTSPREDPDGRRTNAEQADHYLRPFSAGVCVPVFAFMAAGVALTPAGLGEVFTERLPLAVVLGLVVGKFVGVLGGSWLAVRLGAARLGKGVTWTDLAGVALLTGIGFTVSLLIADLSYADPRRGEAATTAVLIASFISSILAVAAFRLRVRRRTE